MTTTTGRRPGRQAIPADAFEHGDPRRYWRGCRCTPCRGGVTKDIRWKAYLRATGRGLLRSPDRAAAHITTLRASGMNDRDIVRAARICTETLYRITLGRSSILLATEQRILAVEPLRDAGSLRSKAAVPAIGARRRLRALIAAGWYTAELGRRLGRHKVYIEYLVSNRGGDSVTFALDGEVRALYQQLATQRPEDYGLAKRWTDRARQVAAERDWRDPLWWEDWGGIDDPDAPETATEGGTPRYVALSEDAQWLMSAGYSLEHAAQRLGVTRAYLDQCIRRYRLAQQQALKEAA